MTCSPDRIRRAYETAKNALLAEMVSRPVSADDPVQKLLDEPVTELRHWVGELSTSALSTATAVMALEQMRRQYVVAGREVPEIWIRLIHGGCEWLVAHQNADGGWGDTVKSISNISTTMLCHAVLHAVHSSPAAPRQESRTQSEVVNSPGKSNSKSAANGVTAIVALSEATSLAAAYIERAGGVKAVIARYGKDHTFSVPILTHCALAGLVDWSEVISLPFELACIPARFYAAVRLPVVSYALPALIAIGQVRFHFRPSWSPLRRWLQRWAKPASLKVLERIQPPNGGFLEATPLTSFVTMSLAAMGLHDHPVAQRGIEFIVASARACGDPIHRVEGTAEDDGPTRPHECGHYERVSWPIDTNLATWVTTLSINALGDDVPLDARPGLRAWLLRQQYRVVHPYTNAAPGGWAWTDLPGGVPDADDTPGAALAILQLIRWCLPYTGSAESKLEQREEWLRIRPGIFSAIDASMDWLLTLQNHDGGWPTFCRGWGTLPFDRSSPDLTAHAIRAIEYRWRPLDPYTRALAPVEEFHLFPAPWWRRLWLKLKWGCDLSSEHWHAAGRGLIFLKRSQRPDGSWLPLWFGNQHAPNDENPTYGTAKVLAAFQALGRMSDESAVRGVRWLVENQTPDGGWGAGLGTPSSVEETALALEALLGQSSHQAPRDEPRTTDSELRLKTSGSETTMSQSTDSGASEINSEKAPHAKREGYFEGIETAISLGLSWLIARVEDGRFREPSPIGFYFAKLWYFEALYPLIFTVAALRKAAEVTRKEP